MKTNESLYPGTAVALYLIADMICQNCIDNLGKFSTVKKKYTKDFIKNIQTAALAAEAMPDQEMRQGMLSDKRIALASANTVVCSGFQMIMGYVEDGFDAARIPTMKKIAGNGYYSEAYAGNWQSSRTLVSRSLEFINDNLEALQTGGMPDTFVETYTGNTNTFLDKLKTYNDYKTTVDEEMAAKQNANNELYKSLQSVMKDGKRIFKNNETLRKGFTYTDLLKKVRKGGKTGFYITLIGEESALVAKASITFAPVDKTFNTDKPGKIKAMLPEGTNRFIIIAPGYKNIEGSLTANAGVMHRKNFTLTQVAAATA